MVASRSAKMGLLNGMPCHSKRTDTPHLHKCASHRAAVWSRHAGPIGACSPHNSSLQTDVALRVLGIRWHTACSPDSCCLLSRASILQLEQYRLVWLEGRLDMSILMVMLRAEMSTFRTALSAALAWCSCSRHLQRFYTGTALSKQWHRQ